MNPNEKFRRRPAFGHHSRRGDRRGVCMAEVAFCLPIVIMVTLATVELCSALFLKESLSIAAYEGARVAVKRRATSQNALDTVNDVLAARGITGATVTVSPNGFETLSALDPVTITITAPVNSNSAYISTWFAGESVTSQVVMVREFDD